MMKRNLMVVGLALLLSACGFQLRGTGNSSFTLSELDVRARDAYGETAKDVRKALQNRNVNVHAGAPYRLVLVRERQEQRTASYTSSARSAEFEKTLTLDYEIRSAADLSLLRNRLEVQRIYVQDGNNLIGSEQEALQVHKEMRADLVQRLIQQLQVINVQELAALEQQAEERARAEAQAREEARRFEAEAPQQSPLQLPIKNQ
jgi:LPS-assembly lipoprotein